MVHRNGSAGVEMLMWLKLGGTGHSGSLSPFSRSTESPLARPGFSATWSSIMNSTTVPSITSAGAPARAMRTTLRLQKAIEDTTRYRRPSSWLLSRARLSLAPLPLLPRMPHSEHYKQSLNFLCLLRDAFASCLVSDDMRSCGARLQHRAVQFLRRG